VAYLGGGVSEVAVSLWRSRRAGLKQPHQEYFNDHKTEFDEGCCSVKRNAEYIHLVYMALMFFFVFSVVLFTVNLLVFTLQKKIISGSHEEPLTKHSDC